MGLSKSSIYKCEFKLKSKDDLLKQQIVDCLALNPSYGHRRISMALSTPQHPIGKKRIRRVMKLYGIKPYKRKARWTKRRDLRRPKAKFNNLVKGSFPIKSNIIWVSDFTYVRYKGRFLYLATFMDLYTREIVGWHISNKHTKDLILEAFIDGFKTTGTTPKIVHSDQGSEFNSNVYTKLIEDLGIKVSMSKKASPWENAYQESFYNNFKTDLGLEFDRFESISHFILGIHQTINYYNQERIHTTLKTSPLKFKQLHSLPV